MSTSIYREPNKIEHFSGTGFASGELYKWIGQLEVG